MVEETREYFMGIFLCTITHCFVNRPSYSAVSEDAGIEPRTFATLGLAVGRSFYCTRLDLINHFIAEGQAFSPSYALAPSLSRQQVVSLSRSYCVSPVLRIPTGKKVGREERSQFVRQQESLVL
jgi:hypothetical protein